MAWLGDGCSGGLSLSDRSSISLGQWLRDAGSRMRQHLGVSNQNDSSPLAIAAHVLGLDSSADALMATDRLLESVELERVEHLLARRLLDEPLSYILGAREFWSLDFQVNPHVLIPRPDSEAVVELVLRHARQHHRQNGKKGVGGAGEGGPLRVIDLGTGSGALVISVVHALLEMGLEAEAWATDISASALEVARGNISAHGLQKRIKTAVGAWWDPIEALDPGLKFDYIISNPPYISLEEWEDLPKTVGSYEPREALTDGCDGLSHYRTIIPLGMQKLHDRHSLMVLECGATQADPLIAWAQSWGRALGPHWGCSIHSQKHPDLAGRDRVVTLRWGDLSPNHIPSSQS